jgi:hypothetical protein
MPPKRKPVDDMAAMLGLPQLEEIAPQQEAPMGPSVADEAAEEEKKIARGGKRTMLIAAAVALAAGLVIAAIVANEMLKRTEPVPEPKPVVAAATQPASAPVEAKNDKPDAKPAFNPAKRALPSEEGGYGLFSIAERVDLLGGRLEVHSARRKGTRVTLVAPLHPESDNGARG